MGKKLISSEQSSAQIKENNNPGCMWGMFQILDYHQWGVKKVFRHKKKINARSGPLKRLTNLMHQAGNKFCADCGTPEPKWVSSSVRAHAPSVRDHDPCARVLRGMQQNVSVIAPAAGKGTAADCLLLARGQTQQIARVIAIAHAMLQNAHVKYV